MWRDGREGKDLAKFELPCVVDDNIHSLSLYSEKLSCVRRAVGFFIHMKARSRPYALLKSEHFDPLGFITRHQVKLE
jgi:hypothetical protein